MEKYKLNDNEEIEFLEKERDFEISQEEEEQLTLEKRQEEAEQREKGLNEVWMEPDFEPEL